MLSDDARKLALELAVRVDPAENSEAVVVRAEKYYEFLKGGQSQDGETTNERPNRETVGFVNR